MLYLSRSNGKVKQEISSKGTLSSTQTISCVRFSEALLSSMILINLVSLCMKVEAAPAVVPVPPPKSAKKGMVYVLRLLQRLCFLLHLLSINLFFAKILFFGFCNITVRSMLPSICCVFLS